VDIVRVSVRVRGGRGGLRDSIGSNLQETAARQRGFTSRRRVVVVEVLDDVTPHESQQHRRAEWKRSERPQRQLHSSPVRFARL
jgi:hypothetical protein